MRRNGIGRAILFCVATAFFRVSPGVHGASSDWAEAPKPAYPLRAALEGDIGEVKLRVVVNGDGRVRDVAIIKGSGKQELDYAARAAVLKWRLNKSRIQPRDLTSGREILVAFQETEKERRIAAVVLRRASEKGSAWKSGGRFNFSPSELGRDARRTARLRFTIGVDCHPRAVQVLQSSGSTNLDNAAVKGIQTWTAYREWIGETAEIPVTFEGPRQPRLPKSSPAQAEPPDWKQFIVARPPPEYPYDARALHLTGSGVFLITFGNDGNAENVAVLQSTGYTILDAAVLKAFRQWRVIKQPPFHEAKIPVTFTMTGVVDTGRWSLGQPELVGTRHR